MRAQPFQARLAVQILKRLAAGHAGARQTRQAAEALARLKARS